MSGGKGSPKDMRRLTSSQSVSGKTSNNRVDKIHIHDGTKRDAVLNTAINGCRQPVHMMFLLLFLHHYFLASCTVNM